VLRALQGDVFKVVAYVVATLCLGALMAPWIYNAGMALAEVTSGKSTNGVLAWLGREAWDSRDDFPRFFDRSLMLAALLLLGPLVAWLRLGRRRLGEEEAPWSLGLPDQVAGGEPGQPLRGVRGGWVQALGGFAVAAAILLVSGWLMVKAGFFMWRDAAESTHGMANPARQAIDWGGAAAEAMPRALVVALVEEFLFRGILLGIFLRAMRPGMAIGTLSLLFALVHFLEPPLGVSVSDPEAPGAGFVLLGQILTRFAQPLDLIGRFLVLTAVGVVLGVARWRTASLWLPIGIHAGWVFAYALFKEATWPVPGLPEVARWLVGISLLEGVLPLVLVAITGLVVVLATRPHDDEELV